MKTIASAATAAAVVIACMAALAEDSRALREARQLLGRKKYDAALERIDRVLHKNPGDPAALQLKGGTLEAKGDLPGAIRAWQKAYYSVGRVPTWTREERSLIGKVRAKLKTKDKVGEKLRAVDAKYLLTLLNFAKDMRRRGVQDLHARVKSLAIEIDPGHRVYRQFLKDEENARIRAEKIAEAKRKWAEQQRQAQRSGFGIGGAIGTRVGGPRRGIGPEGLGGGRTGPAGGGPGSGGAAQYASDGTFDMKFTNQAMMRWLTQMFWMPGNNVPLVENGVLFFETETVMVHHKARLSEGRQLRITADPGKGVVGLGVQGKRDMMRAEGGTATGPGGQTRKIATWPETRDEFILQHVDGRYQGFINRRLIFSTSQDFGNDRVAVTLSRASRVRTLHLEAAETIVAVSAEAATQEEADQIKADRTRAAELLAEGKELYGKRQYRQAVGRLAEASALDPLAIEAQYFLGKIRERLKRRRSACSAFRAYLVTAAMIESGKLKAPADTPALAVDPKQKTDARKVIQKLDTEGKKLAGTVKRYLGELEKLRAKVAADAFTVERLETRIEQLGGFNVFP